MADNKFRLRIITPNRVFYDGDADFVVLRSVEGDLGILKGHAPLTTVLDCGVLRIYNNEEEKACACHGGFMEVSYEGVTILSDACEWPDEIDKERAEESRQRAEKHLTYPDVDVERAQLALRRALVRLETSGYKSEN